MKDRYLFKAKRIDWREFPEKEQWIIGYYVLGFNEYEQPVHLIFEPTSMFFSHGETDGWTEIDPSTICQCTGLRDKNGGRIWENDIVKFDTYCYEKLASSIISQIKWCNDLCALSLVVNNRGTRGTLGHLLDLNNEGEVVGNIFDNPELLGGNDK